MKSHGLGGFLGEDGSVVAEKLCLPLRVVKIVESVKVFLDVNGEDPIVDYVL